MKFWEETKAVQNRDKLEPGSGYCIVAITLNYLVCIIGFQNCLNVFAEISNLLYLHVYATKPKTF